MRYKVSIKKRLIMNKWVYKTEGKGYWGETIQSGNLIPTRLKPTRTLTFKGNPLKKEEANNPNKAGSSSNSN